MTSIWGHRGASAQAPENTLPAFRLAFEQGADGIELDVQRSADGVLVVCHDETIDRTSDGTGAIVDLSHEQLLAHDFSNGMADHAGVQIPTLAQVLELVAETPDVVVNIELKNSIERYEGMEAQVDALVTRFGLAERVWYSSFNHLSLVTMAQTGTSVGLGALYEEQLVRPWEYARGFGAHALHPMGLAVDAEMVEAAHVAGLRVHTWTIDRPEHVRALAAIGVDAIITNVPARAREALAAS